MPTRSSPRIVVVGMTTVVFCALSVPVGLTMTGAVLREPAPSAGPGDAIVPVAAGAPSEEARPRRSTPGSGVSHHGEAPGAHRSITPLPGTHDHRAGGPSGLPTAARGSSTAAATLGAPPPTEELASLTTQAGAPASATTVEVPVSTTAVEVTGPVTTAVGIPASATLTSSADPTGKSTVVTPVGTVTTDSRVDASITALLAAQTTVTVTGTASQAVPCTPNPTVTPVAASATSVASASTTVGPSPAAVTLPSAAPVSSGGWHSGASGAAARDGSFGAWRGSPIQVTAIWGDTTAQAQTDISSLDEWASFNGDIDIAVGGLAAGETWGQAAQGAYANRWRQAIRSIAARRSGKGGVTYIRFAHEMNGDWFTWKVTSGNVDAFHSSWRLFHDILAAEFPTAQLVFSPNNGSHSDIPVSAIYPGDELVDVIGVDFYDGWPSILDQATWDREVNRTEQGDQPYGVGSWQRFAAAHGKALSFPEWGLQMGDHPAFIRGMHDFLTTNAAQADASVAGKVVYDVYFDIAHGGNQAFMITGPVNPRSAALFRSLAWGRA